jgi:AsmA family protein
MAAMHDPLTTLQGNSRRRLLLIVGAAAALLIVAAVIGERHLKSTVEHMISARAGRQVRIGGDLQTHLFSAHPSVSAREVSIANPAWMPPGVTAEAARVALLLEWHWALPPLQIRRLEIGGAKLHLVRDAQGHANWLLHEEGPGGGPPLVHSLAMPDVRVELHDALGQLEFTGTVSAGDATAEGGVAPLRVEGAGQLNGRSASFLVLADPLAGVRRDQPYHFRVEERSGATRLHGQGYLEHAFDFRRLQGTFEIRGPDLGEMYYLVGLKLPQTAAFELSAKVARSGARFMYTDLRATAGESDIAGSVSAERSAGRGRFEAQLTSTRLRLADLTGTAEQSTAGTEAPSLKVLRIPDTPFKVAGLKKNDAVVKVRIRELDLGRIVLSDASAGVAIENAVLSITDVKAGIAGGALTGSARLDAGQAVPRGALDVVLIGAQLERLKRSPAAAGGLGGELDIRAQLKGTGTSWHGMALSADGTVTAVIPQGTLRAALAEAASLELAGALGLMTKSQKQTAVRCAVASFSAHEGVLSARTIVVDTDKALITASGDAQIDTEALDFILRGHPKTAALALHSAVAVRGTLAHPQFKLAGEGTATQSGVAVALGVTLTPVAALLVFVNPGLAHNADCAGLLESVRPGPVPGTEALPVTE